jgi:drug/metabolite transporter (DMT)-like permease
LRGALLALGAATLFGASTPLVQRFSAGIGAFWVAALLYAGAAGVSLITMRSSVAEARLRAGDLPRLIAMAACGAALGPVLLVWGLARTTALAASLMLTLEAVFTLLLARLFYAESMDRRVTVALLLLCAGGGLLVLDQGQSEGRTQLAGMLAVLAATVAWGMDNTLSRALADRDPAQVVLGKSLLGASVTATLALLTGATAPTAAASLALLAIGATGYGLSLRLYLLAQRKFGAARTGSVFAFAPFIGAVVALLQGDRAGSMMLAGGALLMILGVIIHIAERHAHSHDHEAMQHEHAHTHDDGHHTHAHQPMPAGPHSHVHLHAPLSHAHPHVPDAHHAHRH